MSSHDMQWHVFYLKAKADRKMQLHIRRKRGKNTGMEKIETPVFTLERQDGELVATHKPTGVRVPVSLKALEAWLLRKLRELF
jgi:hypothetical protein